MDLNISNKKTALVIDSFDNVAVALTDLKQGEECIIRFNNREEEVTVFEDIPFGHKFAILDIDKDESVLKYGEEIGRMMVPVKKGSYIHNHNMYCERGMK
ncbi:altronate dehydratase [Peribacillus saganii]|uniref:Altronate dehydratase n=1 Tax=Peribacillus saganii TaxID=2303992 RepID=A0A372LAR8_9BACI|nr:UxaA family hydrolase [Peribacillus saganii]RFU62808.1 altronate dehydratase [Peribacillus saganii]